MKTERVSEIETQDPENSTDVADKPKEYDIQDFVVTGNLFSFVAIFTTKHLINLNNYFRLC